MINVYFHFVRQNTCELGIQHFLSFTKASIDGNQKEAAGRWWTRWWWTIAQGKPGALSYYNSQIVPLYLCAFIIALLAAVLWGEPMLIASKYNFVYIFLALVYGFRIAIPFVFPKLNKTIGEFYQGFFSTFLPKLGGASDNAPHGKFLMRLSIFTYLSYAPYLIWASLPWFFVKISALTPFGALQLLIGASYLALVVLLTWLPCWQVWEGMAATYQGPGSIKRLFMGQSLAAAILVVALTAFNVSGWIYVAVMAANIIFHLKWLQGTMSRYLSNKEKVKVSAVFVIGGIIFAFALPYASAILSTFFTVFLKFDSTSWLGSLAVAGICALISGIGKYLNEKLDYLIVDKPLIQQFQRIIQQFQRKNKYIFWDNFIFFALAAVFIHGRPALGVPLIFFTLSVPAIQVPLPIVLTLVSCFALARMINLIFLTRVQCAYNQRMLAPKIDGLVLNHRLNKVEVKLEDLKTTKEWLTIVSPAWIWGFIEQLEGEKEREVKRRELLRVFKVGYLKRPQRDDAR